MSPVRVSPGCCDPPACFLTRVLCSCAESLKGVSGDVIVLEEAAYCDVRTPTCQPEIPSSLPHIFWLLLAAGPHLRGNCAAFVDAVFLPALHQASDALIRNASAHLRRASVCFCAVLFLNRATTTPRCKPALRCPTPSPPRADVHTSSRRFELTDSLGQKLFDVRSARSPRAHMPPPWIQTLTSCFCAQTISISLVCGLPHIQPGPTALALANQLLVVRR